MTKSLVPVPDVWVNGRHPYRDPTLLENLTKKPGALSQSTKLRIQIDSPQQLFDQYYTKKTQRILPNPGVTSKIQRKGAMPNHRICTKARSHPRTRLIGEPIGA